MISCKFTQHDVHYLESRSKGYNIYIIFLISVVFRRFYMIVVFIDLEVRRKTEKVFKIGAIRFEWNSLDSILDIEPLKSLKEENSFQRDIDDKAEDYDNRINKAFADLKEVAAGSD